MGRGERSRYFSEHKWFIPEVGIKLQKYVCYYTNVNISPTRYKDGSLICQAGEPGKYRIESRYGVHTLEINR